MNECRQRNYYIFIESKVYFIDFNNKYVKVKSICF